MYIRSYEAMAVLKLPTKNTNNVVDVILTEAAITQSQYRQVLIAIAVPTE